MTNSCSLANQKYRLQYTFFKQWLFSTSCRCVAIILCFVFGFLYITKVSAVSTRGYAIAQLEAQKSELLRENQKLEVKIATNKSMENIQNRVAGLNMVAVGEVVYAQLHTSVVARR